MLELMKDGILLPEINNGCSWYLMDFEKKSRLITYIHEEDVKNNKIHIIRPQRTESKNAAVWSASRPGTIADYLYALEGIGSLPVMSFDHVCWLTDNYPNLLNTTDKNDKGDYIGNFFFIPKNEFEIKDNIWIGEIVTAAVIRRNMDDLQFGMRFYSIDYPKTFEAKDRRIISLS